MRIISKKINFSFCIIGLFTAFYATSAVADDIVLRTAHESHVIIKIKRQQVNAKDEVRNITYNVNSAVSQHLIRSEEARLITNEAPPKEQLFIILVREPSRPGAMGKGYCGAGYEDYLLLIEIRKHELILRDQLLLQSCLKSIAMLIDQGDDTPYNGLSREKDGSLSYRLVDDDYDKKRIINISKKSFKVTLTPSSN